MWGLKLRMFLLTAILFAIIYAVVSMISYQMGITNFYFYLIFSLVMMLVRYSAVRVSDWRREAMFTPSPITE